MPKMGVFCPQVNFYVIDAAVGFPLVILQDNNASVVFNTNRLQDNNASVVFTSNRIIEEHTANTYTHLDTIIPLFSAFQRSLGLQLIFTICI